MSPFDDEEKNAVVATILFISALVLWSILNHFS